MFQAQATPLSSFASYGASNSNNTVPQYSFPSNDLGLDSGGPIIFDNPTFSNTFGSLNLLNLTHRYNPMDTPPNDDLAEQELLARRYQPELKGPLVGDKRSSHDITEEYAKADPIYVAKTSALPRSYSHYRSILGDGNCGWRAIGFSYFETLQKLGNKAQIEDEVTRMHSLTKYVVQMCNHPEWIFEDMREETTRLLQDMAAAVHQRPQSDSASLVLHRFNDPEASNAIIYYFRLLASAWLKDHSSTFEAFIPDGIGIDSYCKDVLETANTEIEHLGAALLTEILLKPVGIAMEIVYLDRSEGTHVNKHLFQVEDSNGVPINPAGPVIHLLYRPGHYDILYKDLVVSVSNTIPRQHTIIDTRLHSNPQVNLVTSLDQHQKITRSRAADFGSVDMSILANLPGFSLALGSHNGFPMQYSSIPEYDAPAYCVDSSTSVSSVSGVSPISSMAPVSDVFPPPPLPVHPPISGPTCVPASQFRHSKYEYDFDWSETPAQTFLTSTFKNSHFNTAHYNNPNFQPEEWSPDSEEAIGKISHRDRHRSA